MLSDKTGKADLAATSGLRTIAVFEAFKSSLVLLLGLGLLTFIHRDLHAVAEHFVTRLHISPDRPFARSFIDLAGNVTNGRLWLLAAGGAMYAVVRFAEAWGLWFNRVWAQYFGILSGALYLPWEAYELLRRPTTTHLVLLLANLAVVIFLALVRIQQERSSESPLKAPLLPAQHPPKPIPKIAHPAEPRWPSLVTLLAIGLLQLALPEELTLGPSWLLIVFIAVGLVPGVVTHRMGFSEVNQIIAYIVLTGASIALLWALVALVTGILQHQGTPALLLRSAGLLWISNLLVFASWYWRLDAGGPHIRSRRAAHIDGAFLFPQMTRPGDRNWRPGFVDYLFLAFNTSTAFSPTDTSVLSPWAKMLMMLQSCISLASIALLAARAVNLL